MESSVNITAINTKNRKEIANFLGLQGTGKISTSDCIEYQKLFEADYPFPVKTNVYKILSCVFIILFTILMLFTPIFKDWVGLTINLAFVLFSFIAFGFVRNIKYPNEQYNYLIVIIASLISLGLIILAYFNRNFMLSNLFFLENLVGKKIISTEEYDSLVNIINIFFIVGCSLSAGCILYGTLMGKRRFGTMLSPLIVLGGLMLFCLISNISLSTEFLNNIYNSETGNKDYLIYLVLTAALLAMLAYNFIFIHIAIAIGGKEPKQR